jgi:hypothetical protein
MNWLLGARPQTPWVGFAEVWVWKDLPRSGPTLFASFSGKRRILLDEMLVLIIIREAEQRFLLLFLEKNNTIR